MRFTSTFPKTSKLFLFYNIFLYSQFKWGRKKKVYLAFLLHSVLLKNFPVTDIPQFYSDFMSTITNALVELLKNKGKKKKFNSGHWHEGWIRNKSLSYPPFSRRLSVRSAYIQLRCLCVCLFLLLLILLLLLSILLFLLLLLLWYYVGRRPLKGLHIPDLNWNIL